MFGGQTLETRTEFVPVSCGANLATLVALPGPGAYPVIIVRTVYGRRNLPGIAELFGGHGYATVIQDVRGSGDSSGEFRLLAQEPEDAVQTAQWILSQPWCDGRLAILGISYLSAASIAIAAEFPEQVKAAVWVTAPVRKELLCFQDGVLRLHHTLPWTYMRKAPLSGFNPEALYRKTPLVEAIPESRDPSWAAMLEEGPRSRFWDGSDLWRHVERTRVPGLHFGGWFDFLLDATLVPYAEMLRSGAPQRLIIGPWTHNGTIGGPEKISGDVSYGYWDRQGEDDAREDSVDMSSPFIDECVEWLNYWVRGVGETPAAPSVRCFVTGHRPHWAQFEAWPHPSSRAVRMYLGAERSGNIEDLAAAGSAMPGCTRESFTYDPENACSTEGGAVWAFPKAGLTPGPSVSSVHLRRDVLAYDSEALDSSMDMCGTPEVELYASSDAPDTDFVAMLLDVDEHGVARYVSDGIVRARYRNSLDGEDFLAPGEIYLFRIGMKGCAHTFGPGHRVRLIVTSSSFPKFDRNPNTGELVYRSRETRKALQTVYYGRAYPSAVVLPRLG